MPLGLVLLLVLRPRPLGGHVRCQVVLLGELFREGRVEDCKGVDFCGGRAGRGRCEIEAVCGLLLLVFVLAGEFVFEGVFLEIGASGREGAGGKGIAWLEMWPSEFPAFLRESMEERTSMAASCASRSCSANSATTRSYQSQRKRNKQKIFSRSFPSLPLSLNNIYATLTAFP